MSIDFIPLHLYTPIFYYILLIYVLITYVQSDLVIIGSRANQDFLILSGFFIFLFVILYMGLRPIDGVFVDMVTYARTFERFQENFEIKYNDPVFTSFMLFSSRIMTVNTFFLVCSLIYIVPYYIVCRKWFKNYWVYAFVFVISSFSFWAYGVNGIRNGLATSLFILGLSRQNKIFQYFYYVLAIGFHFSMILPVLGVLLASVFNKPRYFLVIWLLSIPISLLSGNYWETVLSQIGIDDPRLNYLVTEASSEKFSKIGFRWDFLVYSAMPVAFGFYYIVQRKYSDKVYFLIFNTYLISNAFWILVIRANYSNRFAYLSWFIIPFVVIYPLLQSRFYYRQHQVIGILLVIYFLLTFFLYNFLS